MPKVSQLSTHTGEQTHPHVQHECLSPTCRSVPCHSRRPFANHIYPISRMLALATPAHVYVLRHCAKMLVRRFCQTCMIGSMTGFLCRWFTSLLLHKSLMQLLASVGVLLLVSYALEQRFNSLCFALLSTIAGVCANFFAAFVSSPTTVMCGPVAILSCHLGEHLHPGSRLADQKHRLIPIRKGRQVYAGI